MANCKCQQCQTISELCPFGCYSFFMISMGLSLVGFGVFIIVTLPAQGTGGIVLILISLIPIMIGCIVCYCAKREYAACEENRGTASTCSASMCILHPRRSGEFEMSSSQQANAFTHNAPQLENWVFYVMAST